MRLDLLYLSSGEIREFTAPRIETRHTHGSGCTYSAAITAELAKGTPLADAVARAKAFITEAIRTAPGLGAGKRPLKSSRAEILGPRRPLIYKCSRMPSTILSCGWSTPLAVIFLLSGLDDLAVDFAWLYAWVAERLTVSRRDARRIPDAPPRPIAILVPLWHEHAVIARMLEHNLAAIRYPNYPHLRRHLRERLA